jgi:hypothetical protein
VSGGPVEASGLDSADAGCYQARQQSAGPAARQESAEKDLGRPLPPCFSKQHPVCGFDIIFVGSGFSAFRYVKKKGIIEILPYL